MLKTLLLIAGLAVPAQSQRISPCISATPICTEWINLGGGPSRSMIYRTYALDAKNDRITRALVVVHGAGRMRTITFERRWRRHFLQAPSKTQS
ncbi:MAG: hypothetical protein DMG17_10355 [Acidobacteria bacterium]|nr:MAG: hypothetical protein DMG17_10355 [Acidobacteriota bacterium]